MAKLCNYEFDEHRSRVADFLGCRIQRSDFEQSQLLFSTLMKKALLHVDVFNVTYCFAPTAARKRSKK